MKTRTLSLWIIIIIASAVCIIYQISNSNLSTVNLPSNEKTGIEKIDVGLKKVTEIILSQRWQNAHIKDTSQIQNMIAILENSDYIVQKNDLAAQPGISGTLILTNAEKIPFVLTDEHLFIQDRAYERLEILPLYEYLIQAINSPEVLKSALISAVSITLKAKDSNMQLVLSDQQKLQFIDVIMVEKIALINYPMVQSMPFPNYSILVELDDGTELTVNVGHEGVFDLQGYAWYDSQGGIKELVAELLPAIVTSDSSKVESLFGFDQVLFTDADNTDLDYSSRSEWFVRILADEGVEYIGTPPTDLNETDMVLLKFKKNNLEVQVQIYKDGYMFNQKYYIKPNVMNDIKAMISAG